VKVEHAYLETPIGWLEISGNELGISQIKFINAGGNPDYQSETLCKCLEQLEEYFNGKRREFTIKMNLSGTDFQRKVWNETCKIPFGRTASYGEIAKRLGDTGLARAVGQANGKNQLPIVIPCHRVIGINGKLTGYAGGLEKKKWLLRHEAGHSPGLLFE